MTPPPPPHGPLPSPTQPSPPLDEHYISALSQLQEGYDRALKHEDSFAIFDRNGDINHLEVGEQGLYHKGTRFVSRLSLRVDGQMPLLLSSAVRQDNALLTINLTNADRIEGGALVLPRGSVRILRSAFLQDSQLFETLEITSFAAAEIDVIVSYRYEADYRDIFEVRGERRRARGKFREPVVDARGVILGYDGLDDVRRQTVLAFDREPDTVNQRYAKFNLALKPHEPQMLKLQVAAKRGAGNAVEIRHEKANEMLSCRPLLSDEEKCSVQTANELFNAWIDRSAADLGMLVTNLPTGPYPYAGVPWFCTVFGRDAILTSLQTLWVDPSLAKGVLLHLAANQATELDPERDAEPGKILHEQRKGEMAALGEIPFGEYYGSIDSTPLFVLLAGEYFDATNDRETIKRIWPQIERALEWIDEYGDSDGDGFVEYHRRSEHGLVNQGWKDSGDSVAHCDGTLAQGPIALCEVQGYVYAARCAAAGLASRFGRSELAGQQAELALELRERFDEAFWCDTCKTYAMALDGAKKPCCVRSSNPGHCLFCQIVPEHRAKVIADTLLHEDSFNGWGIRTVARGECFYNPMSYHNGSVWPHDTAIAAAGLARYGLTGHAAQILMGLFHASTWFDLHRLPELFCGFPRREGEGPTAYPSACSPQAWAAGSVFHLLAAITGLEINAAAGKVRLVHPMLPDELEEIRIKNLRVGEGSVDLLLHRHRDDVGVSITRRDGPVEVTVVK